MNEDINLLSHGVAQKKTPPTLLVTGAIFGVAFFLAFITILITLVLKIQGQNLDRSIVELKSKMNSLAVKRQKIVITTDRLATINKILATRQSLDSKIITIVSFIPSGFTVGGLSVSGKELSVDLSSSNLSDFDNLLEGAIPKLTQNKKLGITSINMTQFQQDGGNYLATIDIKFNSPALAK